MLAWVASRAYTWRVAHREYPDVDRLHTPCDTKLPRPFGSADWQEQSLP
jgi:hypothetical protein